MHPPGQRLNLSGQTATINFNLPANSTITIAKLLPPLNPGRNGLLGANNNSLLIDGSTATNLAINGNNLGYGIFTAYAGNITIQGLSLVNGLRARRQRRKRAWRRIRRRGRTRR